MPIGAKVNLVRAMMIIPSVLTISFMVLNFDLNHGLWFICWTKKSLKTYLEIKKAMLMPIMAPQKTMGTVITKPWSLEFVAYV